MSQEVPQHSLLFQTSPFGTVDAIVEHDDRAIYFYLANQAENSDFRTRACWVRNLMEGPVFLNKKDMERGIPPVLPKTYCRNPHAGALPDPQQLEIVWFEEGNGAALLIEGDIAAIIPPWSGLEGFHGYAAECADENPVCSPMPSHPQLEKRIEAAREFWQSWSDPELQPFGNLQSRLLKYYQTRFGAHTQYYSIDGGQFPPRGLAQFEFNDRITLVTVGMSVCPQPNVEINSDQPALHRRTELALQFPPLDPDTLQKIRERVSSIASYPWRQFTWLASGHTIDFLPGASAESLSLDFVLLANDRFLQDVVDPDRPLESPGNFRGDPLNVNWMIPISDAERARLQAGSVTSGQLLTPERVPKLTVR